MRRGYREAVRAGDDPVFRTSWRSVAAIPLLFSSAVQSRHLALIDSFPTISDGFIFRIPLAEISIDRLPVESLI